MYFNGHARHVVELFVVWHLLSVLCEDESRRVLYGPCLIELVDVRELFLELLPVIAEVRERVLPNLRYLLESIRLENAHHLVGSVRRVVAVATPAFRAAYAFPHLIYIRNA